jgi:hypothetical protein
MTAAFLLIGIAMIVIGCCFADKYKMEDLSKKDAATSAAKATAKGATKAGKYAYDN